MKKVLSLMLVMCVIIGLLPANMIVASAETEVGSVVLVNGWEYEIISDDLAIKGFENYTRASDGEKLEWNEVTISGNKMIHPSTIGNGNSQYTMRTFFPVEGGKTYYVKNLVYNNLGVTTVTNDTAGMSAIIATGKPIYGTLSGLTMYSHVDYGGFNSWSNESVPTIIGSKAARVDKTATVGLNTFEAIINVPEEAENIMVSYGAWGISQLYYGEVSIYEVVNVSESISGTCGDNMTWSLESDGTLTISGKGYMYDYGYYSGSNYVSAPWYLYRSYIKRVVIEDGVELIGRYAFEDLDSLTDVTIADSVITIGIGAFFSCGSLVNVKMPNRASATGLSAFAYCRNLTEIKLSDSITTISSATFMQCNNLKEIIIPEDVKNIGSEAFVGCDSLTDVYYGGSEEEWNSVVVGINNEPLKSADVHCNTNIVEYDVISDNLTTKTFEDYTRASDGESLNWNKVDMNSIAPGIPKGTVMIQPSAFGGGSDNTTMRTFFPVEGGKTYCVKNLVYNAGSTTVSSDNAGMSAIIATGKPVFGGFSGLKMYSHVEYGGFNSWSNERDFTIIGSRTGRKDRVAKAGLNTFEAVITVPEEAENIMVSYGAWGSADLYYGEISIYEVNVRGYDGICGDNLEWSFNDDTLVITGTGAINKYSEQGSPWYRIRNKITNVVLDGVTGIGDNAFNDFDNLIGVYYNNSDDAWDAMAIEKGNESLTNATIHYNSDAVHKLSVVSATNNRVEVETTSQSGVVILVIYNSYGIVKQVITKEAEKNVIFDNIDLQNCKIALMQWEGFTSIEPIVKKVIIE